MAENSDRLPNLAKEFFLKYLNGELSAFGSPGNIDNGQKIIQNTNTPEPLAEATTRCASLWIQTPNNSNSVYLGGQNVNSSSCEIFPNSNGFIDISDLSKIYVFGTSGDIINYTYTYYS